MTRAPLESIDAGGRRGGKSAALRELAARWLEAHPRAVIWFVGMPIAGAAWDLGARPPLGWRAERELHRHSWRAWPAPVWWIRRAWAARFDPILWGVRRGLLECKEGAYLSTARPRGWCAARGHDWQLELGYRAGVTGAWLTLREWAIAARAEWGGLVVLTHARQQCRGCDRVHAYELIPPLVVRVPLPEPELDACALEGWLPELHTLPMP